MFKNSERIILHCDLNSFYASVEVKLNPALRGLPMAVCGDKEQRHGIVLAKTDPAKRCGVQTGEAIWQARQKCPDLVIAAPHFEEYIKYSRFVRNIYEDYTDHIEPFGIDECWLDVTGSRLLFGDGMQIADRIRNRVREELGITISVGVSFNKIFAKLGSDMKKPDAVTEITYDNFRKKIYDLPATDMLGVGRRVGQALAKYDIITIGELAHTDRDFLAHIFGKCGVQMWAFANGADTSPVMNMSYAEPVKSVGRGTTCPRDLVTDGEVRHVIFDMAEDVSHRLRKHGLLAGSVQLVIKDKDFLVRQYQCPLGMPTQSFFELADMAYRLFDKHYDRKKPVRSVTVRAISLHDIAAPLQLTMLTDYDRHVKRDNVELAMETVRRRYGHSAIDIGTVFDGRIAAFACAI